MANSPTMFKAVKDVDCAVISVTGEFTFEHTGEFRSLLKKLTGQDKLRNISLDLTECGFVDSGCMGAMAQAQKELSARGGSLLIVNARHEVHKAMRQIRLDAVIPIKGIKK